VIGPFGPFCTRELDPGLSVSSSAATATVAVADVRDTRVGLSSGGSKLPQELPPFTTIDRFHNEVDQSLNAALRV
jgi:hypothetical protein